MFRLVALMDLVEDEIYPVAIAMLDGSYWRDDFDPSPPDYCEGGAFEVGGGD